MRRRDHSSPTNDADAALDSDPNSLLAFACRAWIAGMAIWTIVLTWPLWSTREIPPLLPAMTMPEFHHYGELLVFALAAFVVWPLAGWVAFAVFSAFAMMDDQIRMQPQIVSFWFLMLGTLKYTGARLLALTHVYSLWFFSGLHKLLSPGYFESVAPWLWQSIFPADEFPSVANYSYAFGTAAACFETILALSLLTSRLKWFTSAGAAILHLGIFATLYQLHWNSAVWPWNLTLAVVVPARLLSGQRRDSLKQRHNVASRAACVVVVLSPLLFYVDLINPYLAHCLYSANVPRATLYPAEDPPYDLGSKSIEHLNVHLPPCHRLYEDYFRRVAQDGDVLDVKDSRAWAARAGFADYYWERRNGVIRRVKLPKPKGS